MTRPDLDPSSLVSGMEGWDALLRDILAAMTLTPIPVPTLANLAAFPAAGSYDGCLCVAADTGKLYLSKGAAWREVSLA